MKPIIEVKHLTKVYGQRQNRRTILDNISFSVDKGEFVGIMGPSGAGKSTLLQSISTITLPTSGIVYIDGQDITRMKDRQLSDFRREKLGFIFQDFNLLNTLNVEDNILLPLAVDKVPYEEIQQRLAHVTELLGLTALLKSYPETISIGQRQRVAAARALVMKPQLIFADEPTGSLDSKSATELLRYLTEINLEDDATILMVTHDPFTASYCNRILFIKDGAIFSELVRHGNRKDFFNKVIDMQAAIGGGGRGNAL
jgi:ABC-type antimicrobial peptide transport system, ATPase component